MLDSSLITLFFFLVFSLGSIVLLGFPSTLEGLLDHVVVVHIYLIVPTRLRFLKRSMTIVGSSQISFLKCDLVSFGN